MFVLLYKGISRVMKRKFCKEQLYMVTHFKIPGGGQTMKIIIGALSEQDKQMLINEFIIEVHLDNRESISIELLKFLRERDAKIEDVQIFNEICMRIEERYFE